VIVDDHPIFRAGLVQTLQIEQGIEIVGQAETAAEAVSMTGDLLPDILLLDIDIPGGGLKVAETVSRLCPVTKIVLLTGSDDDDTLLSGLRAGARAYVLKGVAARELVSILRLVAAGEVYVTPTLAAGLLVEMSGMRQDSRSASTPLDQLSEREHQVLELVAGGMSNKEVGLQLHLTEKTVKHCMSNILQKLQVRNRVEATLLMQKAKRVRG
jgi:DNA-binding NarL/FixJ family response regulator